MKADGLGHGAYAFFHDWKIHMSKGWRRRLLPWDSPSFHVIGQGYIMGPDIILPLLEPNNAAEHIPRVHSNTHVNVHASRISHFPVVERKASVNTHDRPFVLF